MDPSRRKSLCGRWRGPGSSSVLELGGGFRPEARQHGLVQGTWALVLLRAVSVAVQPP